MPLVLSPSVSNRPMHKMVRVKPTKPSSGSRISLHVIDETLSWFTPLNLFFKPSCVGPTELQDFAASLQEVVDRLPLIAGSIYNVEGPHGAKSKELVDDGRGVDLIWVDSPISYVDLPESVSLMPRGIMETFESSDETLLMVKFTKVSYLLSVLVAESLSMNTIFRQFTCGTLAMGISISHTFADCTSCVDLIKEWARVSRGDSMADVLSISSWDRNPGIFFPLATIAAVPQDMEQPDEGVFLPPDHRPETMSNFFFTWESLRKLKDACTPADSNAWVSTGDCVGALLWRVLTITRVALLAPGRDVQLLVAVDGRSRSKVQPDASKYFGNLQT